MSEMAPEGGGGSFLSQRFLGIPAVAWVLGSVVIAYLVFFRGSSGGSPSSGTGGSATTTTGDVTFGRPTYNITVNPQPKPVPKPKTKTTSTTKDT